MPELPEIETIKRQLHGLAGKEISSLRVTSATLTTSSPIPGVPGKATNACIAEVARHGKYLLFTLDNGHTLLLHLRLTGQLRLYSRAPCRATHEVARFLFTDGTALIFRDARKFATLQLLRTADVTALLRARTGVDCLGLEFTQEYFQTVVRKRRKPLKSFLLDQKFFTGVGNIYADEALHQAGLHPLTPTNTLTDAEAAALHAAICDRLRTGVRSGGASVSDYVQATGARGKMQELLRVYGRRGQPCQACGAPLQYLRVSGRGTTYCHRCQPRK